jgi:hypothetical protein
VSAEENVSNQPHTNEVIGAYVTEGAKIHLYRFPDRLQENAIYCDTDSVIFIQPNWEPWPIATGVKLGDMQYKLKLRIYSRLCIRRSKELSIQADHQ